MKKFSFKKITAAVSAAAMIASMGTVAFAGTADGGSTDNITIGAPTVSGSLYTYKVTYNGSVGNDNGITMLAYGVKGDNGANSGSRPTDNKYTTGMQILGVDQKAKTDAGSTTFDLVLTTDSTNANGYYVQLGKPVIVAVNATGSVEYELLETYKTATLANVAEGVSDEGVLNITDVNANGVTNTALISAAETAISGKFVEGYTVSDTKVTECSKTDSKATVSYKVTYAEGVKFTADDTKYEVGAGGLTVSGNVTVGYTAVEATTVKTRKDITVSKEALTISDNNVSAALKTWFEANIGSISLGLSDDESFAETLTLNYAADSGNSTVEIATTDEENKYTATLKIEEGTLSEYGRVKIGDTMKDGITFNLTVSELPQITEITGYNLNEITISDADSWTESAIKTAVENQLKASSVVCKSGENTLNSGDAISGDKFTYSLILAPDFANDTQEYTISVKVSGMADGNPLSKSHTVSSLDLGNIKVKFQEGTPIYLGDVNLDGELTGQDWMAIMNHLSEFRTNANLEDKNSVAFKAADVSGDGELTGQDWMAIMNHLSEFRINEDINTKLVGYKTSE